MNSSATRIVTGLCLVGLTGVATAEPGGLFVGRSGNPVTLPDLSAELGYIKQEDGSFIGARINYRLDERTMLYGDFGQLEFEDDDSVPPNNDNLDTAEASGNAFGVGVVYHMPDLIASYDVSLQASYHSASLDGSGAVLIEELEDNQFRFGELEEVELTTLYAGLVLSGPEPLTANGLMWYGTLGFAKVDSGFTVANLPEVEDDSTDPSYGGGLVLPLESGQAYAGYEVFDGESEFGVGFRYFMQ